MVGKKISCNVNFQTYHIRLNNNRIYYGFFSPNNCQTEFSKELILLLNFCSHKMNQASSLVCWSEREVPRTSQNSPMQAPADQLPHPAPRAWEEESRWATASPESTASRHSNGWPKPKRRAIGTPERQSPESNWSTKTIRPYIH